MIQFILLGAVLALVMYILYHNGLLVMQAKRAVMFAGGRGCKKATFISCSGYIRRVVKFRESKRYRFELNTELSKGEVQMELCEAGKGEILRLDGQMQSGEVFVGKGNRYYLTVRFQSASGKYELDWYRAREEDETI